MNVIISPFQSNFERVFCVWFYTEIFCLTVKRSLEVYNLEVVKKIYLKKKTKKAEQERGKVLYWPSSTVCSNCSNFKIDVQNIYPTSQTLISIFVDASCSNLFIALSIFQTVAWNILLTKKICQKFKGIVTRQAFIYTLT